jgi:hypothetical protein
MTVINNINYLSQRDERWAETTIGSGALKIGRYGCTTTCLSMLTDFFGCYQDPGQIAQDKTNYAGSEVNWTTLHFPTFSFRWREGSYFGPSNIDLEMIKSYLAHGDNSQTDRDRAVILEVANRSHWVVGLWWNEYENDLLCIDPWTGRSCWLFKTYQNITGASLFVRSTKNEWRGKKAPQAHKYN